MSTNFFNPIQDDDFEPVNKTSSIADVAGAQFKLGVRSAETLSAARFIHTQLSEADNDVISAEEANELFPTETPYTENISASKAASIQAHNDEKKRLQEVIANGEGGWVENITGFTANLVGTALDPIGILSGKALGMYNVGSATLNRMMGKAMISNRFAREVIEEGIEGSIGNVVTEASLIMPIQASEQEEIQMFDQLAMAAVSGAVAPAALKTFGKGVRTGYDWISKLPENRIGDLFNYTSAKIDADKNPNITIKEKELTTREDASKLTDEVNELNERIDEAQSKGEDTSGLEMEAENKALELEEYRKEYQDVEAVKSDANSESNDIYNQPEVNEKLAVIDSEPEPTNIDSFEKFKNDADELQLETIKQVEDDIGKHSGLFEGFRKSYFACFK